MAMSFAQRVEAARLTRQERVILATITHNLSRTAFLGGPQLAEACGVAPSAITRFAQKLGYKGFPELKVELEELYRQTTTPYEMFEAFLQEPRSGSVAEQSIAQDLQNLSNLKRSLNESTLEQVVDRIERARTVHLAAISGSEAGTLLLGHYLRVLSVPNSIIAGHGLSKRMHLTDIGPRDLLIAIAYQKIFREVRELAVFARQKGATTVAITDSPYSRLAEVCDLTLIAPVTGATFGYSHVGTVAMVNVLINSLAARDPKGSLKKLEEIRGWWNELPLFCDP